MTEIWFHLSWFRTLQIQSYMYIISKFSIIKFHDLSADKKYIYNPVKCKVIYQVKSKIIAFSTHAYVHMYELLSGYLEEPDLFLSSFLEYLSSL